MPDKKKSAAVKTTTERRMPQSQVSQTPKTAEPHQAAAAARAKEAVTAPSAARQLASFEAGIRFLNARRLKEAREQFVDAAAGPERDVAQRARLHIAMCDRRLQQATVSLGSAEDYYNYGIALINSRNVAEARTHLEKALQIAPGSDHIHYALALAQALSGDVSSAYDNLKRAIELEPRNRLIARQDADFGPMAHQPPFDALLHPEKKSGW
jgi:tetratricopeptide (TPR) repeat protein